MSSENSCESINLPIERIVALQNPFSSNGERGNRQLEELRRISGLPVEPIMTDIDPTVTDGKLKILEPTDLLYVIGGDGTINQTIGALMASQAILMPTRSGNACDLAVSANGRNEPWQIYNNYKNRNGGANINVSHPIEVTLGNHGDETPVYAINYVSFGYGALAMRYINGIPRTNSNGSSSAIKRVAGMRREGSKLMQASKDMRPFKVTFQDDNEKLIKDISFVHSPRMAKLGRIPISHTDDQIFESIVEDINRLNVPAYFLKMMLARLPGEYITSTSFRLDKCSNNPLYYQVDGEASLVPDDNDITVGLAQKPVRILSTFYK